MIDNLTPPTDPCTDARIVLVNPLFVEIEFGWWPARPLIRWVCPVPACAAVHEASFDRRRMPGYVRSGVRCYRNRAEETRWVLAGDTYR